MKRPNHKWPKNGPQGVWPLSTYHQTRKRVSKEILRVKKGRHFEVKTEPHRDFGPSAIPTPPNQSLWAKNEFLRVKKEIASFLKNLSKNRKKSLTINQFSEKVTLV